MKLSGGMSEESSEGIFWNNVGWILEEPSNELQEELQKEHEFRKQFLKVYLQDLLVKTQNKFNENLFLIKLLQKSP